MILVPARAVLLLRDRAGIAAVEFALLLPFFVVLLFGIFQFGTALFIQTALQHAVTHAARCASEFSSANSLGSGNTPPDCSTGAYVQTVATQQAFGLSLSTGTFTACLNSASCTCLTAGVCTGFNCVSASYPFTVGVPFLPLTSLTLAATSCYPAPPS